MLNIKKQINVLYITSILGNLSITGAWVAILASRGFSLVQIGFAETIFHITSLIFEIPSGILADIYGRKRMLIVSNIMEIIGNAIMALSNGFWMVCVSMVFHALSYNFQSGSGDALAYDSLKSVNQQDRYEKYSSNQLIIYRIGNAISTLCAGMALFIGYRVAYILSALSKFVTLMITFELKEIRTGTDRAGMEESDITDNRSMNQADDLSENVSGDIYDRDSMNKGIQMVNRILKGMIKYFADSILFLKNNSMADKLMFSNSLVGVIDILLLFFLQAKLTSAGISNWGLGIALFLMELGGIMGARFILRTRKLRYSSIFIMCTIGVIAGVCLEHTGIVPAMILGGFISAMADDALQVRTDARLQDIFPSEQRATLISLSSFMFSMIMIVLSPLAGYFFSIW